MKNRPYGFAFGALLALSVVMLSAQVGGFPSRPRFQAVGIGKVAPAAGNMDILVNANTAQTLGVDNDSNGTANLSRVAISSGDVNLAVFATGSGRSTAAITNGPTGAQAGLRTLGAHPIVFGTSNTLAATISSAQVFDFVNSPTVAGTYLVDGGSLSGGDLSGCSSGGVDFISGNWTKVGGFVTMELRGNGAGSTCTSNSTSFSITGLSMPAQIIPAAGSSVFPLGSVFVNNGATVISTYGYITSGGNLQLRNASGVDASWTAALGKGLSSSTARFSFSYYVN